MLLRDIVRRSGRSLRSAKARTLLTAAAIAVGTFALTMTMAASNGATAFVNRVIADNFDPAELIVAADKSIFGRTDTDKPKEYDPSFGTSTSNSGAAIQVKRLTDSDIATLKSMDGVEQVREGITVNLQYITRPGQKKYVASASAFNPSQKPDLAAGSVPKPLDGKRLILPEAYVSGLGFSSAQDAIGKTITMAVLKPITSGKSLSQVLAGVQTPEQIQKLSESNVVYEDYTVAAVAKKPMTSQPGTELYLYVGTDDARALNDIATEGTVNYRKYNYAYVKVKNGNNPATLKTTQTAIEDKGYLARSVKDTQAFLTNIISILQGIVAAFGAIAIIASVFGIVNTMYISVLQRTREIGLMKALGMRQRDIGRLFRFEAAWIGFIGGLLGSAIAIGLGTLLNPVITKQLSLGDGNNLLIFKPVEVVVLIIILMLVSIAAGWLPSRKAARLDPIEALRTE